MPDKITTQKDVFSTMFHHNKRLQYEAKPSKPDALFANKVQEVLGGQYGEMTVMTQYLFQGWSCRGPAKYKDMLLDIGTEEIGHVEMLCTMIARLLEGAPVAAQEAAHNSNPMMAAILGGMNPQQAVVSGGGPRPTDSMGNPWSGAYMTASGNMFADFHSNLNAEVQGRLQVCRLYEMTDDVGIRDTFAYMIARDTMHQNQWLAAIEDMKSEGMCNYPVPLAFTADEKHDDAKYQFWNLSEGTDSQQGRWASGQSPDGKGQFTYVADPQPLGPEPTLAPPDAHLYNLPQQLSTGKADGAGMGGLKGTLGQVVATVKDKITP